MSGKSTSSRNRSGNRRGPVWPPALELAAKMRVQILKAILAPEALIILGNIERCAKDAAPLGLFKIARIGVGAAEHAAIGELGIKACGLKQFADQIVLGCVALFGPTGAHDAMHKRAEIAAARFLRGNDCIGGGRRIGREKRRLEI
jgi:hypothetical protein